MSTFRKPLSAFQHHILHVVANLKTPYGLGINTGQGYQNCETLVEEDIKNQRSTNKLFTLTQIQ